MAARTLQEALAAVHARFLPLIEAQSAKVLLEDAMLTDLVEQEKAAILRVREYYDALEQKPEIDAAVSAPPEDAVAP